MLFFQTSTSTRPLPHSPVPATCTSPCTHLFFLSYSQSAELVLWLSPVAILLVEYELNWVNAVTNWQNCIYYTNLSIIMLQPYSCKCGLSPFELWSVEKNKNIK